MNCENKEKAQDNIEKTQDSVENTVIQYCDIERSIFEIMDYIGYDNRNRFTRDYITPMVEKGLLSMTIPDKPTSRNQKYIAKK